MGVMMDSSVDDLTVPVVHGEGLLKTIRYEDASDGVVPVKVRTISPPPRSSSRSPNLAARNQLLARGAALAQEAKRDSGIAPSSTTIGRTSYGESLMSSGLGGAARSTPLPTIVVQDEDYAESIERSKSPPARRRSRETPRSINEERSSGIQRVSSFRGINTDIPTGSFFDDISFEDLASDKLAFSKRGSLLFGGKKMNDRVTARRVGQGQTDGTVQPIVPAHSEPARANGREGAVSSDDTGTSVPATVHNELAQADPREDVMKARDSKASPLPVHNAPAQTNLREEVVKPQDSEAPRSGLVSGRRKPSVHMLQTALEGGRVLSAEEISFSMKVRSMYERGEEHVADYVDSPVSARTDFGTASRNERNVSTSLSFTSDVQANGYAMNSSSGTPAPRRSFAREPHELAGGIEDWDAVNKEDVDRYGFIVKSRVSSRQSIASQRPSDTIHRVASALRHEAEQPRRERKLRRGLSNAKSSHSVAPRTSRDTLRTAPASMHSFQSQRSGQGMSGPFMSKDNRTLADAANMLTLPPGLADVAEYEDASSTANVFKKREWERDEKWQKMARPIRDHSNSKGGGMRFDFDTTDPKLVNRTWKGIPDRWRAMAWHCFLSTSARRRGKHESDEQLVDRFHQLQDVNCADDVQIDVDVPRTISMHIMFRRRYRGGQRLLFRVLHAISLHCPEPGYVQGMASLAATLLCYFDEEQAFVMLVRLWQLRGLEQLFKSEFVGLIAALNEFEREWLRGGDVAQKLEELGIPSTSYGTRWYLTLFNLSIPFPAQLRVWDVFMLLGDAPNGQGQDFGGADLDVLHATSAALIDATRDILLEADFETAMKVLTSFVPIQDEDLLMRVARTEWKLRKKRAGIKL
ncbi:hypothetical protein BAUCODRAFT_34769 [Baudoinia panamericana UAMH 10762]|uniref:Rab-GAP TBC domain-containing protein n=1 Tax=Baudoinia panamericana (strain UAMH 10762) TaxID=717646 RepID=M2LNS8_BAUPA|nr:uncharacterized protein BAUCODRAFT_34769 [Baudoinia panamericana UAMH 10762]EMC96002.1 hypothetical protein BAUCODRAFT_34769 [Baudoinia panamericana UAMH 10762]